MTHHTYRGRLLPLGRGFALCALFALAGSAYAQPDILSVAANASLTSITIKGTGLQPTSGKPTVSLGSYMLGVGSFSNVQIDAALPANLKPGSDNLEVTANGAANFDVTIAAGGSGPAGPAGPAGPTGATGPQGAPGTGGAIALPFSGVTVANQTALQILSNATSQEGIQGSGGPGASPVQGGTGVEGDGGPSSGGRGGNGVFGVAGPATIANDFGGDGGEFNGGGSDAFPVYGGDGVYTQGGDSALGGFAGNGIEAFPGSGPSDGLTYGLAANFGGNVTVNGNLSKAGGSFVIDHPADPANKYLYHSFVESPDMMNIYNGNTVTDASGSATVAMPDWFESLNSDFRYQLTTIGQLCQATVASEINHNTFTIKTDKPNVKVSWQVTGIRQDAWANAHRIPLEVDKAAADQGHYIHPELFGHKGEPSIAEMHNPRPKKGQQ